MKEPRKDDERLSALLQGQVSGPERDELLAHLAASDDDYEVFNDAVEILGALEAEEAGAQAPAEPATVIPMHQPRRPWRPPARWVALAAVLAGVVLVAPRVLRERRPAGGDPVQLAAGGDPVRLAADVYDPGQELPEGWTEEALWSGDRGDGLSGDGQVDAARAGAKLVELAVAVQARDTAATKRLAAQLKEFEPGIGGATPLRKMERRPGAPPEELEGLLERATVRLAERRNSDHLQLGAWTRAALFAAAARDQAFFRDAPSRDMLLRAEGLTRDDAAAHAALVKVREALPAEGAPKWDVLEAFLKLLLREIAS